MSETQTHSIVSTWCNLLCNGMPVIPEASIGSVLSVSLKDCSTATPCNWILINLSDRNMASQKTLKWPHFGKISQFRSLYRVAYILFLIYLSKLFHVGCVQTDLWNSIVCIAGRERKAPSKPYFDLYRSYFYRVDYMQHHRWGNHVGHMEKAFWLWSTRIFW